MLLQNTLDLSIFEIVRFRIWNQTSQPSDRGFGSKYFNTNSGHEAYCREEIFTPIGWRTAAYLDDIEALTNGEGSLGTRVKALEDMLNVDKAETVVSTWAEIQAFLDNVKEGTDLMTMLDGKAEWNQNISSDSFKAIGYGNTGTNGWKFNGPALSFGANSTYYAQLQINFQADQVVFRRHTTEGFSDWKTLLHSGNVGDYAIVLDTNIALETAINHIGYGFVANGWPVAGPAMAIGGSDGIYMMYLSGRNGVLRFNTKENGTLGDWKTIAFTDSDITGNAATATALKNKVTLWGHDFDGTKDVAGSIYFSENRAALYANSGAGDSLFLQVNQEQHLLVGQGMAKLSKDTLIYGNNIKFCYGSAGSSSQTAMTITEEGNVLVGTTTGYDNTKVQINGLTHIVGYESSTPSLTSKPITGLRIGSRTTGIHSYIESSGRGNIQVMEYGDSTTAYALNLNPLGGAVNVGGNLAPNANNSLSLGTSSYRWSDVYSVCGNFSGLATFRGGALIPTGQTLTIGSVTFRETAAGEVEVDGNLHTTGTLASGGKGEVGENTTGNAMVYQYDLASGESVYTVDNVKGSTNVIVQIFEWNSNTSSWDMILTDVSVKADAITVTFGRTTTVNHMVTVC